MLKNQLNYLFIKIYLIILLLILPYIDSQQIKLPLKLINTTFSKYKIAKTIYIKKNSLLNINLLKNNKKRYLSDSKDTLSANIDILSSFLFATEIEIGSNNQKFNVVLDTGSQILWVPEVNSNNTNTEIKNYYEPKKSKTSKDIGKSFEIFYGTGYCKGNYYQDMINFLSNEKYNIIFGSANKSMFDVEGADGIMGLAKSYSYYLLSPLLTLKKNGLIKSTSFSFKYESKLQQLFFYAGEPHSDFNTNNIAFCNLLSNTNYEKMLWACKLNSFGLVKNINNITDDRNIFAKADISVILDTGTNVLLLPYYLIYEMEEKLKNFNCVIGSTSVDDFGSESAFAVCFDIYNIPDISLQFGDYVLILNKYKMYFMIDLGLGITGYILNVHFQKDLGTAIIGQHFFTEFHTLFDSENNILKFYSDNKEKIINLKKYNNNKNNNNDDIEEGSSILRVFFVIFVIFLLVGFICYRNKKKRMMENVNQFEWMGQSKDNNDKFNNINNYNAMV